MSEVNKPFIREYSVEEAKAILWQRGDTTFKLHAGQERINAAFEDSKGKHLVFTAECSRQFGKTSWGVWLADRMARKHPGCSIRIATAYYADIESLILPAFRWLLEDCPIPQRPIYQAAKGKWVYPNGLSEIQLVGLDRNPNKLRGSRLRLILVEEAGFSDSEKLRYAYESVIVPATTHEPDARVVFISTPPESGTDHYFCEMADICDKKGAYIKLTIDENPLLTPDRVEDLARDVGGRDSITFKREYLCQRVIDTRRAIIPEFDPLLHVRDTPRNDLFSFYHRYEALDSGVRDQTVALLGHYDFTRGKLVVEDMVTLQGAEVDTRRIATEIRKKEHDLWLMPGNQEPLPVYRRVSDNDNLILIADLGREYGLHFTATSKDSLEAMVNKLRLWFQDGRIEIHPRCKHLIGNVHAALWNKTRDGFQRSEVYGHSDALAALMYLVRNVDTFTNPIPVGYGVDKMNTITINPGKRLSQAATAIIDTFSLSRRK